ncbi:hypothetical protein BUALT_Bualt06G0110000 [Buddleja alternifolia]|uniref:Leucine-rich repeat and WD repeat-containing protein 1 LRR domain-containing protein n=1 Tax=Buddleja alternifolia TaxID=168488 RepID=A0AAV6XFV1_9LAMI|nr:hypothetical protein BUALT_Bualt06G0110000 [Buddleja alternifolia]
MTGTLPEWMENYLVHPKVLRLRNNEFYGLITSAFCQMSQLQIIDLANNKLTEAIPHCFGTFLGMMKREHSDTFRSFEDLQWLEEIGEIPSELTNLSALIGLNLSHNHLGGKIPAKIGDLKSLISLDLSNNLFGTIPDSLSNLNFLSHLNVSHNNLSGSIPTGNQIQTLEDPSIYDGNPQLCGAPLHKKCHNDEAPNGETHVAADEDDQAEKLYLYGVIISGFATGFGGLLEFWHLKGTGDELISAAPAEISARPPRYRRDGRDITDPAAISPLPIRPTTIPALAWNDGTGMAVPVPTRPRRPRQ